MGRTPKAVAKQLNMNDKLAPPENIKDMFGSDSSSDTEVAKELFASTNIKTRTEVNDREINLISRLDFMANEFNNSSLSAMLDTFMELKVSRKRYSRKEFIEALKNMPRSEMNLPGLK